MKDLRERIFDDLVTFSDFAKAIGKSVRTVHRMKCVSTTKVAGTRYVIVSKTKERILRGAEIPGRGRRRRGADL
jgi:hypothetical protein